MIINVEIPGIQGLVRVEGDFATETAINRLTAAMSGSTSSLDRSINDTAGDIDGLGDDLNQLGNRSRQSSSKIKDFGDNINLVAERLSYRLENLARDANGSSMTAQSLTTSIGSAVGSFGKLGSLFGPIGGAIGGVFEAAVTGLTGLAGAAVGMIEQFGDLNSRVFDSGLAFSNGLDGLVDAADTANVPIHEFGNAVLANVQSLRLMSGGGVGGIKAISNAFAKLTPDLRSMLFSLGYTTEDIVGAMADYGSIARLQGKQLSSVELAGGTAEYLKNLKELSKITGTTVAEEKANQERLARDAAFNQFLRELGDPAQAKMIMDTLSLMPASMQEITKANIMGIQIVSDKGLAALQVQTSSAGDVYKQIGIDAKRSQLTAENLKTYITVGAQRMEAETTKILDGFGSETMAYTQQLGGTAADFIQYAHDIKQSAIGINEADKKRIDTNNTLSGTIGSMKTAVQTVIDLLQSNFVDLLQGVAPTLDKFFKGIGNVATELDTFTEDLKKYFFGNEQEQEAAKENLIKTIKEWWKTGESWVTWIANSIWDSITGAFKGLYEVISQGITNALSKFWNMLANSSIGSVLGIESADSAQIKEYEKEIQGIKLAAARQAGVKIKNERGGRQTIMAEESAYLDNKTSQEIINLQKKIQAVKDGKVGLDLSVIEGTRPIFTNEEAANNRENAREKVEMSREQASLARKSVELQEKQLELYKSTIEKNDEQIRILKQQVEELTKARTEARANAMARS